MNINQGPQIKCKECGKTKEHHGKGLCWTCYRKQYSRTKKAVCKRCNRERVHKAKGLCASCYEMGRRK